MPGSYRELPPPPGLEAHLACIWISHDRGVRVLPDGCADVVYDEERLVVAGPATVAAESRPTPGRARFGVRFRVSSAGAALGLPAAELLDQRVELTDLWGLGARRIEDRVAAAGSANEALAALVRGVGNRLPSIGGDALVRAAALALISGTSVRDAGRTVGLGERQLRRRFDHAVGYGPATFQRVHRFQVFLHLAESDPAAPLARLAADAGYADQAHLTRECRRLSGLSPAALLADGVMAAGDKSVSFKPAWELSAKLAA